MLRNFFHIPSSPSGAAAVSPAPAATPEEPRMAAAGGTAPAVVDHEALLEEKFGRSPQTIRDAALPRYDLYRHSVLRAVGYSWYLTKGFEQVFPHRVVRAGRTITWLYVVGDPLYKMEQMNDYMYQEGASGMTTAAYDVAVFQESLCWQLLGSVALPMSVGAVISKASQAVASRVAPSHIARYVPGVARILAATVLIQPLDRCVDWMIENSLSEFFNWSLPRVPLAPKEPVGDQ